MPMYKRYKPMNEYMQRQYAPLIAYLEAHIDKPVRLAIDGRCAAGKTTLAQWLQAKYDCPVIQMDAFFLQAHQRTPERLAQAGGNVDYERFAEQVLAPLTQGQAFAYQPYACQQGQLLPFISVPASRMVIVEGAYSLHPLLRENYTCKVMCNIGPDVQIERIRKRNGEAGLQQFCNRWIPLEEVYLQAHHLPSLCDFVFDAVEEG